MSKWRVELKADGWLAYEPGRWMTRDYFPTHTEAMAYADEQARTITITLPRVGESVTVSTWEADESVKVKRATLGNDVWISFGGDDRVIYGSEVEPLALTLLALARKGNP